MGEDMVGELWRGELRSERVGVWTYRYVGGFGVFGL